MKSSKKSAEQAEVGIADYYAIKVGAIFRGGMQESFAFWCSIAFVFVRRYPGYRFAAKAWGEQGGVRIIFAVHASDGY